MPRRIGPRAMTEREHSARHRDRKLKWLRALKDGPCTDCRKKYPPECMELDHVRGRKIGHISKLIQTRGIRVCIREAAKCDLVCANCHRIRTMGRRKAPKHVASWVLERNG